MKGGKKPPLNSSYSKFKYYLSGECGHFIFIIKIFVTVFILLLNNHVRIMKQILVELI